MTERAWGHRAGGLINARMRERSDSVAAIVNGTIVLRLPLALMVFGAGMSPDSNTSTTVRAPGGPGVAVVIQQRLLYAPDLAPHVPFMVAMLAAAMAVHVVRLEPDTTSH